MSTATWDFPNEATPPGSASYYVVRFSPQEQQHRLARWYAWFAHLDNIAAKANDPGVARLKLDWWREETRHMQHNSARHPLAQALQRHVDSVWQVEQMHRALLAVEQRILRQQPRTHEAFDQQCRDQAGSRLHLLCETDHHAGWEAVELLGRHVALTQRLAQFRHDLQDNYLSLPVRLLEQHGIGAADLERGRCEAQMAQIAEQLLECQPIGNALLAEYRHIRDLHPALRHAAQSLRMERLLRKRRYQVHRLHQLTPLGLLWSAWRMR